MENGNLLLSEKEQLAIRETSGDNLIIDMSGKTAKDVERDVRIKDFNKEVDFYAEKFQSHVQQLVENTKKIAENIENIEIMPIGNYVLVHQFESNPFQKITREGSIITDLGGMKPIYKNTDNGEWEQEKEFIKVGVIQDVGPDCKWCKPGDTVMYTEPSAVPVPFYKQGLILVNETRVLVVINEGLTERFKKL